MKLNENVILADNSEEEVKEFKNGLEKITKMKWFIYVSVSNQLRKNIFDEIVRYIKYFIYPLRIFFSRKQVKNIVAWQQFYGIIYAFYCNLFKVKKNNKLIIMTFIYKPRKKFGKLYFKFIKYAIDNKYVDNIIVFSKNECEYYSKLFNIKMEKFKFVNLSIDEIKVKTKYEEYNYVLSVGRSNRDYDFLIEAMKDEKYNVKIVCDKLLEQDYNNIKIYNDVNGDKYYAMLKNADCVVIPLKDKNISSGQLVILQAMQMRIPIIVTETRGVRDYIKDGYNGLLIKNTKEELMGALNKLKDPNLCFKLISNGYKEYNEKYSLSKLGENVGKIIKM